jgi:hypothetical protein
MHQLRYSLTFALALFAMLVAPFGYASGLPPARSELVLPHSTGSQLALRVTQINLATNDIIYDPNSDKVYAKQCWAWRQQHRVD